MFETTLDNKELQAGRQELQEDTGETDGHGLSVNDACIRF